VNSDTADIRRRAISPDGKLQRIGTYAAAWRSTSAGVKGKPEILSAYGHDRRAAAASPISTSTARSSPECRKRHNPAAFLNER